jgi:hypothetical protein
MKKIALILATLMMAAGCTPAEAPSEASYSYSDGSGNAYFITESTVQYDPITAAESSSGVYDGGEPKTSAIDADQFDQIMTLFDQAASDESIQIENRAKGSGYFQYPDSDPVIIEMGSVIQIQIEALLSNL